MTKIIKYLYKRFVHEIYIPWNVFESNDIETSRNLKGTITVYLDKERKFQYLDIDCAGGFHSYEYISYPFYKYNYKVDSHKARIHNFAYKLEEKII